MGVIFECSDENCKYRFYSEEPHFGEFKNHICPECHTVSMLDLSNMTEPHYFHLDKFSKVLNNK